MMRPVAQCDASVGAPLMSRLQAALKLGQSTRLLQIYGAVKVHRGGYWLFFGFQDEDTAVTPNGEMYFPGKDFKEDYSLESVGDQGWFIHEMTHVWQCQLGYWVKSIGGPCPNMSYAYTLDAGKKLCDSNMEAQGDICGDYYLAVIRGLSA